MHVDMPLGEAQRLALLNPWQRDFPLRHHPYEAVAAALGWSVADVLSAFARLQREGALSRIGGVFAPTAGGAALLAAMAVPPRQLEAAAATVSAHPGVNHNYQREHAYNLWFVMTGRDAAAVERAMQTLEAATGCAALRLRMQRVYRIDLGFDLRHRTSVGLMPPGGVTGRVADAEQPLAALVETGLPFVERPYDLWAQALGWSAEQVLATLRAWLSAGTMRRFGVVVRHQELGFSANAMTVFDVPPEQVDACGEALAAQPGITLAYRRERAPAWPFNLYCMVHGRDRAAVHQVLDLAIQRSGLQACPRQVLFSCRRFKQTGARRFRELPRPEPGVPEVPHAVA